MLKVVQSIPATRTPRRGYPRPWSSHGHHSIRLGVRRVWPRGMPVFAMVLQLSPCVLLPPARVLGRRQACGLAAAGGLGPSAPVSLAHCAPSWAWLEGTEWHEGDAIYVVRASPRHAPYARERMSASGGPEGRRTEGDYRCSLIIHGGAQSQFLLQLP